MVMNMISLYLKDLKTGFKKDWCRITNILTLTRLICSPIPGIILLSNPGDFKHRIWASAVFLVLALTDLLDGFIARHFNRRTEFGRLLDPIADIVFGLLTLIALSVVNPIARYLLLAVLLWKLQGFFTVHKAAKSGKKPIVEFSGKLRTFVASTVTFVMFCPVGLFPGQHIVTVYAVVIAVLIIVIPTLSDYRDSLEPC